MKGKLFLGLLVVANLVLAGFLVSGVVERNAARAITSTASSESPVSNTPGASQSAVRPASTNRRSPAKASIPSTPFAQMYSQDATKFVANLRSIHCPEETVKDILVAEISRRFHAQEEALRPKPADHVPFTWSANPSERKLLQRRQQAAAIAREKSTLLRDALGYEVPVAKPVYAMTSSDQRFEDLLTTLAPDKRSAVVRAQEDYWAKVQALQDRTKGFWQSDDVAELEQFKKERKEIIESLPKAQ